MIDKKIADTNRPPTSSNKEDKDMEEKEPSQGNLCFNWQACIPKMFALLFALESILSDKWGKSMRDTIISNSKE